MDLTFEVTRRTYAIEIDIPRFLHLLDSENHVTEHAALEPGAQTLQEKLDAIPAGIHHIDYGGHSGAAIHLTIDDEDDSEELRSRIAKVIEDHLAWCATLPKYERFSAQRAANRAAVAG